MNATTSRNLPLWGYVLLALVCASMGAWASYVTLEYFQHGARALESDRELQALALLAAMMFVASEMGAFLIAALMPEKELWLRRWALTGFAFAVLGLEVCTIVAVQLALTTGADMEQVTITQREKDLRGRIADIESDAAITRDAGAVQAMAAKNIKDAGARAWALQQATKTVTKASARSVELNRLHEQLEALTAQKRPTLVGVLGKENAMYYAVARGILISMGGLVFFGTAGALARMARGVVAAKPESVAPESKPVDEPKPEQAKAPAFTQNGLAPSGESLWTEGESSWTKWNPFTINNAAAASIAVGTAGSMGMAHALPTIAPEPVEHIQSDIPATSEHIQSDIPKMPKQTRKTAVKVAQMDTGTTGNAATRYNRIKAGVLAGKIRPSINALMNLEGEYVGQAVAREYISAMERDGVLVKDGRFWKLAPQPVAIDPRQMNLGGL